MDVFAYYIKGILKPLDRIKNDVAIFVVSNVKDVTNTTDYSTHSVITDFFSIEEFEEIINGFRDNGFYVESFTDELDFINFVQQGNLEKLPLKKRIVYNTTQKGIGAGRHSLILAFCKALNIPVIGSNAYVAALCRHKYHSNKLINEHLKCVPKAWLFEEGSGWLLGNSPPLLTELIIKPIHEAASIGVSEKSCFTYTNESNGIISDASRIFKQPIIAEQFIDGYEVEVPILIDVNGFHSIGPVGISISGEKYLGKQILSYDNVYDNLYSFYDFSNENPKIGKRILSAAAKAANILGFQDYARLDFRIDKNENIFLTDTTNNPHIVSHSSFNYWFQNAGLPHSDLLISLLALASKRYGWC